MKLFPRLALIASGFGLFVFGLWLHSISTPMVPKGDLVDIGYGHRVAITSHNVKFVKREDLPARFKALPAPKLPAALEKLSDLLVPPAEAVFGTATNTVTPGANVNLQLASPQASAAYVLCNFAISPVCKVYANAAISTLAFVNGIDGSTYTVVFQQPGPANTIPAPTAGGTPAAITTQVAGWAVQAVGGGGAMAVPTSGAQTITIWTLYYDSANGSFVGIVN